MKRNPLYLLAAAWLVLAVSVSGCIYTNNIKETTGSIILTTEASRCVEPGGYTARDEENTYYLQLSQNEKAAYNLILKAIQNHEESVEIAGVKSENLLTVFEAVAYDHPKIACVENRYTWRNIFGRIRLDLEYALTTEECRKREEETTAKVHEIIGLLQPGMTEFERELFLHDYLVQHCSYKEDMSSHVLFTAYGALVKGEALCEGYARAMKLLLNESGISCSLVMGKAKNGTEEPDNHMWNLVSIEGKNYHLDPTWNMPSIAGRQLLRHTYFNLSDEAIQRDHFDYDLEKTHCTSVAAQYFVQKGLLIDTFDTQSCKKIVNAIVNAAENTEDFIEIQFANSASYQSGIAALFEGEGIYDLIAEANKKSKQKFNEGIVSVSVDDSHCVVRVQLERK